MYDKNTPQDDVYKLPPVPRARYSERIVPVQDNGDHEYTNEEDAYYVAYYVTRRAGT